MEFTILATSGVKRHKDRLRKIARQTAKEVVAGLYRAGQLIELEAERSITSGSISGAGHIPSLPGQPPNADTRFLDSNIETTIVAQSPPKVQVISHAPYSAALEYGTSKMEERPFMRPAVKKHRADVTRLVKGAVAKVVRQS
jgi:HK97 gp10 family phage protein